VQSSTLIVTPSIKGEEIKNAKVHIFCGRWNKYIPWVHLYSSADKWLLCITTMNHNLHKKAASSTIGRIIRENCNIIHPTARQEIGAFKVYLLAE
jgi:hypothetical protein